MAQAKKSGDPGLKKVLSAIGEGKRKPIYIFHGPNISLINRALDLLKKKVVGDDEDFAYQVLRGDEVSGANIRDIARTVPMLAAEQLIVVRNADALSADDLAQLLPYLEDPTPSSCLVMVAGKVDKRLKFFSKANKKGYLYEAGSMTEREIPGWIRTRGQERGLNITAQVAHILSESTGTDPETIEDALERLSLYIGEKTEVSAADVETVVTSSRVHSIFELTDGLGRRDVAGSLRTLSNMLRNREAPLRILATLATHMRRLLHASELGSKVLNSPMELASQIGVPPFLARKISEQCRKFSCPELRRALRRIADTDIQLKSSRRSDHIIMEEMVLDLCLGIPPASQAARQQRQLRRTSSR